MTRSNSGPNHNRSCNYVSVTEKARPWKSRFLNESGALFYQNPGILLSGFYQFQFTVKNKGIFRRAFHIFYGKDCADEASSYLRPWECRHRLWIWWSMYMVFHPTNFFSTTILVFVYLFLYFLILQIHRHNKLMTLIWPEMLLPQWERCEETQQRHLKKYF